MNVDWIYFLLFDYFYLLLSYKIGMLKFSAN